VRTTPPTTNQPPSQPTTPLNNPHPHAPKQNLDNRPDFYRYPNWPALLAVFAFIPTFNLVMILLLSALPTKDSGNKYGLPATWVEDLANGNRLRR